MMQDFNHKHILVRAEIERPPVTVESMDAWLLDTVAAVGMKVLMGPFSVKCETEGNIGVTGVVVIETSHLSCHSWQEADIPFLQMDLYSCKDFDSEDVLACLNAHFGVKYVDLTVIDRNCDRLQSTRGLSRMSVIENFQESRLPIIDGDEHYPE